MPRLHAITPAVLGKFLEIHNPKVGSSSLPRAIAHCPASAGLFVVWTVTFGDSTTGPNVSHIGQLEAVFSPKRPQLLTRGLNPLCKSHFFGAMGCMEHSGRHLSRHEGESQLSKNEGFPNGSGQASSSRWQHQGFRIWMVPAEAAIICCTTTREQERWHFNAKCLLK